MSVVSGCALLGGVVNKAGQAGSAVASVGGELVGEAQSIIAEADARAKSKCDPIRTAEVAWVEERAMGGVVSIQRVNQYGSLVLDGITATEPDAVAAQVKESEKDPKKKVSLADSPKNDLAAYVSVVGRNLARLSSRSDIPWTFAVIENESPNAFSAPGGYVVVTTGLLRKMTNEAQLAGVLAHEIGHVVHKHSIKRYRTAKADQCAVAVGAATAIRRAEPKSQPLVDAVKNIIGAEKVKAASFADSFENFDLDRSNGGFVAFVMDLVMKIIESAGNEKEDEFQADATALELIAFAGYDASEYETLLTSLGESGGGFSKHPATSERVAKLKALRTGDLAPFATGTAKPDVSKAFAPIKK